MNRANILRTILVLESVSDEEFGLGTRRHGIAAQLAIAPSIPELYMMGRYVYLRRGWFRSDLEGSDAMAAFWGVSWDVATAIQYRAGPAYWADVDLWREAGYLGGFARYGKPRLFVSRADVIATLRGMLN